MYNFTMCGAFSGDYIARTCRVTGKQPSRRGNGWGVCDSHSSCLLFHSFHDCNGNVYSAFAACAQAVPEHNRHE